MRFLVIFLMLLPSVSLAQNAATLLADRVILNDADQLIASGNVEVLFEGSRLTAAEILFDRASDTLQITGPIFIQDADGTILTADTATLDPRLENGILQGARIVLDQQLQLAATQIDQQQGRFTQLYKTSATSCRVCGNGPPLWEIRAERVIRDAELRQLYFENATFRVRGVPLIWLPRMRLPDPTLSRSTGLLVPEQRNTTQLGFGIKLPYFFTLGDHRDLTVTPYVSAETKTLELRYRQAFANGNLEVEAAVSDDTLVDGTRGYLFAEGKFALANAYQLRFDIETSSDPAYLLDYGYSSKDRLDSALELLRVTDQTLFQTRLTYYGSLRETESNDSLPPVIADITYARRMTPRWGGSLDYELGLDTEYRPSNDDGDAGRDVLRAGGRANWTATRVLDYGLVLEAQAGARADLFLVDDDSNFAQSDVRFVPDSNITLRWPLARRMASGTQHVLEPVIALGWAQTYGGTAPNEDSTRNELDRANLLATSRFAGEDAIQTGPNVAVGLTWSRYGAQGVTSFLSFGRVIQQDTNTQFTTSSGLDGSRSDWLIAGQFTTPDGFIFDARSLWEDSGDLTIADARIAWSNDVLEIKANYGWQSPDPARGRTDNVSEWTFDAGYDLSDAWRFNLDARYDVAGDRPVEAGGGVRWRNECVSIDVSVSRRYTSSTTVEPTTTFGLSGTIGGFSTGRAAGGIATGCGN